MLAVTIVTITIITTAPHTKFKFSTSWSQWPCSYKLLNPSLKVNECVIKPFLRYTVNNPSPQWPNLTFLIPLCTNTKPAISTEKGPRVTLQVLHVDLFHAPSDHMAYLKNSLPPVYPQKFVTLKQYTLHFFFKLTQHNLSDLFSFQCSSYNVSLFEVSFSLVNV